MIFLEKERTLPAGLEASAPFQGGYEVMVRYGSWRVAVITWAERFQRENIRRLERHTQTDEVFVLMTGAATLFIGQEGVSVEMEPYKVYNVTRDTWHAIAVSKDAQVLICEDLDTGLENTAYMDWQEER